MLMLRSQECRDARYAPCFERGAERRKPQDRLIFLILRVFVMFNPFRELENAPYRLIFFFFLAHPCSTGADTDGGTCY